MWVTFVLEDKSVVVWLAVFIIKQTLHKWSTLTNILPFFSYPQKVCPFPYLI